MTYEEAAAYISEVPKFTKKNAPENTLEMLRRLGHPEENFRVIHVAGTNGKGSVCAFISSVLQKAGYRTGLFTSPHLVRINERFQINRECVSDEMFLKAYEKVSAVISSMLSDVLPHPTYFEMLFAIGMVIFAAEKVEYLVMETGMGGRLDATNAVAHPAACVITSISLDHTEYLGNTIEEIAFEKAGIIKPGVPVIYDAGCREAARVIAARAEELGAPAVPFFPGMAEVVSRTDKGIDFVLNNKYYDYRCVHVPFPAEYQVMNSALAMMALRVIDPERRIDDETVISGISGTSWEGRMETILPGVILDGAHNPDGVAQLMKTVREVRRDRPAALLFAAVSDKHYEEMIRTMCEGHEFCGIIVTQVGGKRAVKAEEFAEIFRRYTDVPVRAVPDAAQAFDEALSSRPEGGMLFCAGSLYLVGEIKEHLQ